jgi:SAM-dependent methyltransferase
LTELSGSTIEPRRSRARSVKKSVQRRVLPLLYAGDRVECPCCARRFRAFAPYAGRPNAWCPACQCLERHRLLWLYLSERTDLLTRELSVIHFAPERALQARLRELPGLRYASADLDPSSIAELRVDITDMPFPDSSFDVAIVNHVLEHVPDDRRALSELARVLVPGGVLYTMHPVEHDRGRTYEDPAVRTPRQRRRAYGDRDDARVYGRDFADRVRAAGFDVTVERYLRELPPELATLHGLVDDEIYVCAKPVATGRRFGRDDRSATRPAGAAGR